MLLDLSIGQAKKFIWFYSVRWLQQCLSLTSLNFVRLYCENCHISLHFKKLTKIGKILCEVKVTQSCLTLHNPMDYTQSMEFLRSEYWSGQPFPSPSDLPNPGVKPRSPTLQVDSLPTELPGMLKLLYSYFNIENGWGIAMFLVYYALLFQER